MIEALDIAQTINTRRKAWTVKELAELLNVSQSGIYSAVSRGSIPSVKIGSATRFDPRSIANWWNTQCAMA